jgi:hypothetical protein
MPSDPNAPYLDIDKPGTPSYDGPTPAKSLKALLKEVPHLDYDATIARFPERARELERGIESPAADPSHATHPPSFLSADDIDNYLWEIDMRLAEQARHEGRATPELLPTLAPAAAAHAEKGGGLTDRMETTGGPGTTTNRDFALRNPTSVYNWLRKNEPKVFLQDGEATPADKENGEETGGGGRGRKSMGGEGGGRSRGGGARASKRGPRSSNAAAAAAAAAAHAEDTSMADWDDDAYEAAPRGKRKRQAADEDGGYRPKGGSSRPAKRKRKSEGAPDTPTSTGPKRMRKSDAAVVADGAESGAAAKED